METIEFRRPRNLDWPRAAALLYGDWGTSKAYVLGLAFVTSGFSSLPIILAVCGLTALVGANYVVICRCFPEGGGVYSSARSQSRLLAIIGALLLVADLTVTAALSGWAALSYLEVPSQYVLAGTIAVISTVGILNYFGPRPSGSLAVVLAVPTILVVVVTFLLSVPHLSMKLPVHGMGIERTWSSFVSVILALSGVEAIANLTGILKLDKGSSVVRPQVGRTAFRAILPVAIEVSVGTALLGWAMLSIPEELSQEMFRRGEDMIRFIAEFYGGVAFGVTFSKIYGFSVGIIFSLLLFSAVNTAVTALVGLLFITARDGEMPRAFLRLNSHGVPVAPLAIAVALPCLVLVSTNSFEALAGLYAIGVVGAICVNLGSCSLNWNLTMHPFERWIMFITFLILVAVELTLARTKPDALFFVLCVLVMGLSLRAYVQRLSGLRTVTISREIADIAESEEIEKVLRFRAASQRILVCLRGVTSALEFAFDEALLRRAELYILYVREVVVLYPGMHMAPSRWEEDPQASVILNTALKMGKERGIPVVPVFASAAAPAGIIVDLAATLGADFLILGSSNRSTMDKVLKGNVASQVAANLPDSIPILIYG
ncbi:MAG: amino acid permease [Candidatus Xiphinematobacter sp.]|nr:MAG: amino acid permease [Candidatus Xiphinematobacter sp.]